MSLVVDPIPATVHHLTRGSFMKTFRVPAHGDVTVTTYRGGEHFATSEVTLEEARRLYRDAQRTGWEKF